MTKLRITRKLAGTVLLLLGALVLIVFGGFYLWDRISSNKDDKTAQKTSMCVSKELESRYLSAYSSFKAVDTAKLTKVVTEIKSSPGHKDSTNCLYIVGKSSRESGEYAQAIEYYEALLQLNKNNKSWIDTRLGAEEPKDIELIVEALKLDNAKPRNILKTRPIPPVEEK